MMKAFQVGGSVLVCVVSFVVCCLAGGGGDDIELHQQKAVASLKSPEMKQPLQATLGVVENAQHEVEVFQARVAKGEIPIQNNNGVWCAVLDESKAVVKMGQYASQTGPLTHFMKVVYSDVDHKARLNEQSYDLYFSTNGILKRYVRADMQEMSEYHPDGKIKSYSAKTGTRWYTAKWDDKDGRLLNESSSIGTLGEPSKPPKKDE